MFSFDFCCILSVQSRHDAVLIRDFRIRLPHDRHLGSRSIQPRFTHTGVTLQFQNNRLGSTATANLRRCLSGERHLKDAHAVRGCFGRRPYPRRPFLASPFGGGARASIHCLPGPTHAPVRRGPGGDEHPQVFACGPHSRAGDQLSRCRRGDILSRQSRRKLRSHASLMGKTRPPGNLAKNPCAASTEA